MLITKEVLEEVTCIYKTISGDDNTSRTEGVGTEHEGCR